MKTITVIGAGAWGTTVANHLAHNGHTVTLWCNEETVAQAITTVQCNTTFLADASLNPQLLATHNLEQAIRSADILIEAVPVAYLRTVLERAKPYVQPDAQWVILSKGIEQKTDALPSDILCSVMGNKTVFAVVGGPNFAKELIAGQFTATTVASHNQAWAKTVAHLFSNKKFITHISSDPVGVQLCGALKNVVALLAGIAHGAGYGHNTGAYIITQGLAEMSKVLTHPHFNAQQQTAYGLAGMGDLILTCTGILSKNFRAGMHLGAGGTLENLHTVMPVPPEGVNTTQSLYVLIQKLGLDLPLLTGVYKIVFEKAKLESVLSESNNISIQKL